MRLASCSRVAWILWVNFMLSVISHEHVTTACWTYWERLLRITRYIYPRRCTRAATSLQNTKSQCSEISAGSFVLRDKRQEDIRRRYKRWLQGRLQELSDGFLVWKYIHIP
ncbi:hypothetical protein CONLIGDRAFT_143548 [Coniochaeta ligniaria NRRL 30616]|uniref:Secreted protein n=1 Tax=Coniochaeta ligniaria NRRL 30616 TaxID=1408157 RepID=A0A1J7I6B0_9PEZI|nr:hypothetical protein CONLIGDRAFT_143548 [Coniochaeta ligniaria NRRL 30616]